MLKRYLYAGIFSIVGLVAIGFVLKNEVGDIRPAFLPTQSKVLSKANGTQLATDLILPNGFKAYILADGLHQVRDLEFSPGGTLLASILDEGKIVSIDAQGTVREVLTGLVRPHGIAFYRDYLFVAEEQKLVRYHWDESHTIAQLDRILFALPRGGRHNTRSIVIDKKANLFVSIGSTCDVCDENDKFTAAVVISDINGKPPILWSTGLRNAVFMAIRPNFEQVWTTEMGRDFLGDTTPPDEINVLENQGDYGWPRCYGKRIPDKEYNSNLTSNDCSKTVEPTYLVPAHSAPLGLTFVPDVGMPADWRGDLVVAYHGSWNRSVPDGYKVVRLHIKGNTVVSSEDFITGFLQNGSAVSRPVDVTFDKAGTLFLSDDKGGRVYKIIYSP